MSVKKQTALMPWEQRTVGLHCDPAEGLEEAITYANDLGCRALQLYTKNPRRWLANPLKNSEVEAFTDAWRESLVECIYAHAGQLINLAAGKRQTIEQTMESMRVELLRTDSLHIPSLIVMPGSHQGDDELTGIRRVSDRLNILLEETCFTPTRILLKCSGGGPDAVGYSFEHLRDILANIREISRIGICLNTAHLFSAGYDMRTPSTYAKLWQDFHRIIGIDWLHVIQVSDTTRALGAQAHKHAHIGKGKIGSRAFGMLVRDPRIAHIPLICDTPSGKTDTADRNNLAALKKLAKR